MPELAAVHIPAAIAAELYAASDGESRTASGTPWVRLADRLTSRGPHFNHRWLVVSNGAGCFGVRYQQSLSGGRPSNLPWAGCKAGEELLLTPMVGVPVTSTKYLTEREYGQHLARGGSDA